MTQRCSLTGKGVNWSKIDPEVLTGLKVNCSKWTQTYSLTGPGAKEAKMTQRYSLTRPVVKETKGTQRYSLTVQ